MTSFPPLSHLESLPTFLNPQSNQDEEQEENEKILDVKPKSPLSKWDRASRVWLSSGTFLLLVILFHALQVRNDLRRFIYTANDQLNSACYVFDNKVTALQSSLDSAALDVGPITLKFLRDFKGKMRSAFQFGAQIFGGRLREMIIGSYKHVYCAVIGILVVLSSLMQELRISGAVEIARYLLFQALPDNVFTSAYESAQYILERIIAFVKQPEKFLASLIFELVDQFTPEFEDFVELPQVRTMAIGVCEQMGKLDFDSIQLLLRRYLIAIILVLAMVLVLYNSIQFIKEVDIEDEKEAIARKLAEKEHEIRVEMTRLEAANKNPKPIIKKHQLYFLFIMMPSRRFRKIGNWFLYFLSYQPLWIFFTMGILGVLHIHFTEDLIKAAKAIKTTQIDPEIDRLTDQFVVYLHTFVAELNEQWGVVLKSLFSPITDMIRKIINAFSPFLEVIQVLGGLLDGPLHNLFYGSGLFIRPLMKGAFAFLECLLFGELRKWSKIGSMLMERYESSSLSLGMDGSVVSLLKRAISAIIKHLRLTKALKKMFTASFLVFLRMFKTRSMFMYVYLIACLILIMQGVLMALIKMVID